MLSKRSRENPEQSPGTAEAKLKRVKTASVESGDSRGEPRLSGPGTKLYSRAALDLDSAPLESVFLEGESDRRVPLLAVTETMLALERSGGAGVKNKKVQLLAQLFSFALDSEPLVLAPVYMVFCCKVFPDYDNRDFGIGNKFVYQFISSLSNKTEKTLKAEMKKLGDLGSLAAKHPKIAGKAPFLKLTFEHWFAQIRALTDISRLGLTKRGR